MKRVVVYGLVHTGDYLIVVMKKLQHVPFQGRHDYHLTTACTNETHRNKWVHVRLSPPFLFVKPTLSKAKEFASAMVFKEVYVCEILISETERNPVGKSVQGTCLFLSGANWMVQKMERQAVLFSISLIQMLRFTLICCKIQSCLT
jgi:hypothetical protein